MTDDTVFQHLMLEGQRIMFMLKYALKCQTDDPEQQTENFEMFIRMLEKSAAQAADPKAVLERFVQYHMERDASENRLLFLLGMATLDQRKKRAQA
jgi:hypothetical protein